MANGYLLALRDEGLIDATAFAELDEQIFEATGEWIANSLVADGDLVIGPDGEKYWAQDQVPAKNPPPSPVGDRGHQ